MAQLDLSGVDPLRREEMKTRVAVIERFLSLSRPTEDDRLGYAAELGLHRTQFMKMVRAWKAHGNVLLLPGRAPQRNKTRVGWRAVPKDTEQLMCLTLQKLGTDIKTPDALAKVNEALSNAGLPLTTRSTVRRRLISMRQGGGVLADAGDVIIADCRVMLPVASENGIVMPDLLVAVHAATGRILAVETIKDKSSAAERLGDLMRREIPDAQVTVDGAYAISLRGMAGNIKTVTAGVARRLLSRLIGDSIGDIGLRFNKTDYPAARLLKSKEDRPLREVDALDVITNAVNRHNAERDKVPGHQPDSENQRLQQDEQGSTKQLQQHTRIRNIRIDGLVDRTVDWLADTLKREEAPGVIVGLSGTDSILTYIYCLMAFERLGKPLNHVRGVNFQHKTQDKFVEMNAPFVCMDSDDTTWVEREIFPWIRERWPEARLEVDTSIRHSKDGMRWGTLHDKAKEEVNGRGDMLTGTYYFPVGTRNATEDAVGAYTLITKAVSLFPIIETYKTEVIDICRHFGVPEIAIAKSQDIDCDCGRFEVQAFHMLELDQLIMVKAGLIPAATIESGDATVRHDVSCFLREERFINEFKDDGRTPYRAKVDLAGIIATGGA